MTKWVYGEEGEAFPVRPGEVWACGGHLFCCSDLMASGRFERMFNAHPQRATLVYCDPPWGQSLVNSFRTKAGLGRAGYRWEELYQRIAQIGHSRGLPVWVEGSRPDSRDGQKIPSAIGSFAGAPAGVHSVCVGVTYYRKHLCGLYYCGPGEVPAGLLHKLAGKDDEDTPGIVMASYGSSGLVIDPCAGQGATAREAQRQGWLSINNELHPNRMSCALVRMAQQTGLQPVRVS